MMKYFDATTSDKEILKRDIIRDMIYLKAEQMLVGKNAVNMMPFDGLDIKFDIPKDTVLTPEQVAEGAVASLQKPEFYQINQTMDKYQTRVLVTYESEVRQIANSQVAMSIEMAAQGLAEKKDDEIFGVLASGAALTQAAAAKWDTGSATPATDIANAIGKILDATTVLDTDIANTAIFYPAKLWGHLAKPIEIGEMQMTLRNWAEREYKVSFFPTRQLTNSALVVVKSPQTAYHLTYAGGKIPTSEEEKIIGVGHQFLVTQYFKTFVVPYAQSQTTTKRICTITTVC